MKKKVALLLILALMMSLIAFPAIAADNIKLEINGSIVTPSVAPVIENGTTLVPLRIVSENLGATVDWNGETRQVTINKDDIKIILTIDSVTANVNDMDITLLLAPKIINSTTMVPIRFVSENLKAFVNWDSATRTVQINENDDFTKPAEPTTPAATITKGQQNALESAKQYLAFSAFSYDGLIDQLEYEKYTHEEAVYGADNCGANWNEQALKSAKDYLNFTSFSYDGLIKQLEYEKFTHEQAVYGASNCGADWNEQAALSAESYLEFSSFSREGLIDQLKYDGFTESQALYGVKAVGY